MKQFGIVAVEDVSAEVIRGHLAWPRHGGRFDLDGIH
jgi:hypothetical protein